MEFPNNLLSSQNLPPQKGKVMFLHYCPHNPDQFDRED
jgi:cwf18 pre-mRNA splicing factor